MNVNSALIMKALSFIGLSLVLCAPDLQAIKLLGIFNNLAPLGKIKAPRVDIVNDPINITSTQNIPSTAAGTIHPIEFTLPAYINITYGPTINNGEPFTIKIEDTGKPADCPGHKTQVKVGIKDVPASIKKVCISQAISEIVGTRQDRWQNVLLALGNNPKYAEGAAKGSEGEFPFVFGLSGWSSSNEPWNRDKISMTSDKATAIKFDKPLSVIQGHAALGGGSVPRFGHATIEHIYNDSPYILLVERAHLDKRLSTTNFREIVPPLSAVPFAMMYVPKITDKKALQKSAIYIHAMGAPAVGPRTPPPPTAFEYIFKAGTSEIGASPMTSAEIEDFVTDLSKTNPHQTAEILGEETLDQLISNNYSKYFISKYYYKVYSVDQEKRIYVERCKLGTDDCTDVKTYPFETVTALGDPHYFKLLVQKDKNPKQQENFGITLDISPVPYEA